MEKNQEGSLQLTDLALQKTVTSEVVCTENHTPDAITDANPQTYWEPSEAQASLVIDLGENTRFNRVTILEHSNCNEEDTIHILGYELSVSEDKKNFDIISAYQVENPETKSGAITLKQFHSYYRVDCKQQNARYIKFSVTKTKPDTLPQITGITVNQRPVTELDREWSNFINDTSWQKEVDVSAIGRGSLIANYNGGTLQLKVTDRPYVNDITSKVIFTLDNPELATVSETGLVTAKASGVVRVTATSKETGLSGSLNIEILEPDTKFKNTWGNLISTYKAPDWYTKGKFGLYFHWGAYAVIARENEWFISRMHKKVEDDERFFLDKFGEYDTLGNRIGYKDCYKYFSGDQFNADVWAELAKKAGAKFIIPTSEHHDGFTLYNSDNTRWKATNWGPKRDVIQELKDAAIKQGLKFGFSNHYKEKHVFMDPVDNTAFTDTFEPNNYDFYSNPTATWDENKQNTLDQYWYNRTTELVDKYDPDFVLFDWHVIGDDYTKDFLTHYYNHAEKTNPDGVVMTIKLKANDGGFIRGVERGQAAEIRDMPWEGNTSISRKSWGYIEDESYESSVEIVDTMADIVSKNGIFLLNVGPDRHGIIPKEAQMIITEIGDWMEHNGDAIYNTKPWSCFGEGPTIVEDGYLVKKSAVFTADDYRFTQSIDDHYLYIIGMRYPFDKKITIKTLNSYNVSMDNLKNVVLLNGKIPLTYEQTGDGFSVTLPDENPDQKVNAFALRLEFDKEVPLMEVKKYKITVEGGTSIYRSVKAGITTTLNAFPGKNGAVFKKWEVLPETVEINDPTSPYAKLVMPECDIVAKAIYDQEFTVPVIIKSEKQITENNAEVTFESDADYVDFINVLVDGKVVSAENYFIKNDKITITLKPEYVSKLTRGMHTFAIATINGAASCEFLIKA